MTTVSVLSQGTTLTYNSVVVTGHTHIKGIGSGKASKIPSTSLLSTAMEYRQGLQDNGEITIGLVRNQDDLGQIAFQTAKAAQTTNTCVIVLSGGTLKTATFQAFVVEESTDIDKDGIVTGEVVLCISGPVVWS
jgi:hypothetical protein